MIATKMTMNIIQQPMKSGASSACSDIAEDLFLKIMWGILLKTFLSRLILQTHRQWFHID